MGKSTRSNLRRMARVERINDHFDLEIRNIRRTDNYLALETSKGSLRLTTAKQEEGFLIFLFSAQQHLKNRGFDKFVAIHQAKNAFPFIKFRGKTLVLFDGVEGEEFSYTRENVIKGIETLAEFHKAARGFNPMPGSEFKVTWGKWPDYCFQDVNDLVKLKLVLKERRPYSFDEKLWKEIDYLIQRGLLAWQRFNHENYRNVLKHEMEARAFNIHSFKADKLRLVGGEVFITEMNRIRFEIQVYDLADYLSEILQKTDIPVEEIAGYVRNYTKIRPLSPEEKEALLAFVLYPRGLYRLIRHYYTNRRVRDAVGRFDELIRLTEREEELAGYLERELE